MHRKEKISDRRLRGFHHADKMRSTGVDDDRAKYLMIISVVLLAGLFNTALFAQVFKERWIGTAPFCSASPADCTDMGWNYVKSDKSGDGKACASGTKVLLNAAAGGSGDVMNRSARLASGAS